MSPLLNCIYHGIELTGKSVSPDNGAKFSIYPSRQIRSGRMLFSAFMTPCARTTESNCALSCHPERSPAKSKDLAEPLRLCLYGVLQHILEKLQGSGVEGHRLASAARRTDLLRTLPPTPQTSMRNLAAETLTADLPASSRRCVPPQLRSFFLSRRQQ